MLQEGSQEPTCQECGSVYNFTTDVVRGDIYCSDCGAVYDTVRVVAHGYKRVFNSDDSVKQCAPRNDDFDPGYHGETVFISLARLRSSNSAPYKRSTYLSERLSQWRQREPEIEERDWWRIKWKYQDMFGFDTCYVPTKEDIRCVLRSIDEERAKTCREVPRFVRKYLEKFLTIRYRLCGIKSHGVSAPAWIDKEVKIMFAQLEEPFNRVVRDTNTRSSFPNYNFCIRRFFDLLGCSNYNVDFPPLKSQKKREDIILIWLKLIHYLKWPYINTDGEYFGTAFAIDARELVRRRRRASTTYQNDKKRQYPQSVGDDQRTPRKRTAGSCSEAESATESRGGTPRPPTNTDSSAVGHRRSTDGGEGAPSEMSTDEIAAHILNAFACDPHRSYWRTSDDDTDES